MLFLIGGVLVKIECISWNWGCVVGIMYVFLGRKCWLFMVIVVVSGCMVIWCCSSRLSSWVVRLGLCVLLNMNVFIGCWFVCVSVDWKKFFCNVISLLCLVIVLCMVFRLVVIWLWMVKGNVSRLLIDFCMCLCELVCLIVILMVLWKFG